MFEQKPPNDLRSRGARSLPACVQRTRAVDMLIWRARRRSSRDPSSAGVNAVRGADHALRARGARIDYWPVGSGAARSSLLLAKHQTQQAGFFRR